MMHSTVYLGFDPGAITGVAWTQLGDDTLRRAAQPPLDSCDLMYELLLTYDETVTNKPTRIIVSGESYTMGSSVRTHQPDALYVLGAVDWMIHRFFPSVELRTIGAASASHVGNIKTLKAAGWWTPGDKDQQNNRAAAQVAHAMMMTQPRRWYDLIKPSETSDNSDKSNRAGVRGVLPEV